MPIRPVKCLLCEGQMYYSGESGFEPEVTLKVEVVHGPEGTYTRPDAYHAGYAHQRCYDAKVRAEPATTPAAGEQVPERVWIDPERLGHAWPIVCDGEPRRPEHVEYQRVTPAAGDYVLREDAVHNDEEP